MTFFLLLDWDRVSHWPKISSSWLGCLVSELPGALSCTFWDYKLRSPSLAFMWLLEVKLRSSYLKDKPSVDWDISPGPSQSFENLQRMLPLCSGESPFGLRICIAVFLFLALGHSDDLSGSIATKAPVSTLVLLDSTIAVTCWHATQAAAGMHPCKYGGQVCIPNIPRAVSSSASADGWFCIMFLKWFSWSCSHNFFLPQIFLISGRWPAAWERRWLNWYVLLPSVTNMVQVMLDIDMNGMVWSASSLGTENGILRLRNPVSTYMCACINAHACDSCVLVHACT